MWSCGQLLGRNQTGSSSVLEILLGHLYVTHWFVHHQQCSECDQSCCMLPVFIDTVDTDKSDDKVYVACSLATRENSALEPYCRPCQDLSREMPPEASGFTWELDKFNTRIILILSSFIFHLQLTFTLIPTQAKTKPSIAVMLSKSQCLPSKRRSLAV